MRPSPEQPATRAAELRRRVPTRCLIALLASGLCACSSMRTKGVVEGPTLKSLAGKQVEVLPDYGIAGNDREAIAAYRSFLEVTPLPNHRLEAMRRLGDLEMDGADNALEEGTSVAGGPDYRSAIAQYEAFLHAYPKDLRNDRVLYQLARAHEQTGALEVALGTLDRLVQEYPQSPYIDEVQFRRGEMLFAMRDYGKAELAFASVLRGQIHNPYRERSLYMHGWSLFKLARLDEALQSFFGVLDLKLGDKNDMEELEAMPGLTPGNRELLEDTFRVASLCLENLQGAASIAAYIDSPTRRVYEFRVYQQLGRLYLKQDRVKDAADTLGLFAKLHPLHAQAPVMQAQVIDIYQGAGFANLALEAKKDYVTRYGVKSEFRLANPLGWIGVQPLLKAHLVDLSRHFHASAQKSKSSADVKEAVYWYRTYLASFPTTDDAAQSNFLLAELLFEDGHFSDAATEFEKSAYGYPAHAKSSDAGYAALLSYAAQEKRSAAAELPAVQQAAIEGALRFAQTFRKDPRRGSVLTNAAEKLFAANDGKRAASVAQQVLALHPPAAPAQRRVAWTVIAHTSFEAGEFDLAEKAYAEVLGLTAEKDAGRHELAERHAASIYKQGEIARSRGELRQAVDHFSRVPTTSKVRAAAQYDAAAALMALKDWDHASQALEDFRRQHPGHALQGEVPNKLALAYTEKGQWAQAAVELERIAAAQQDPKLSRDIQWQAAEMFEKAGARAQASTSYQRYLKQYPQPLELAVEARFRLARLAKQDGQPARELMWMRAVLQADQSGASARTDRTRYLGATAALAIAEPTLDAYRKVALVEPLAKQLKSKKAKMQDVLKAYEVAAQYGVADVTTAATYHIASLYQDFGRALMTSQRPKKLKKAELEQYNVLLEEQAFPFEEKATELHEMNARRAATGIYDVWVQRSYKALGELRPLRYGKVERSEGKLDAIQ